MRTRTTGEKYLLLMIILILLGGMFLIYATCIDGVYVNRPLTNYSSEMQTLQTEYCAGDVVVGHWSFCKNTDIPAVISWSLVNSTILSYTPRTSGLAPGCYDGNYEIQTIPEYAEPGIYHFVGRITYKTLGGYVHIPRHTNEFIVIKCEKDTNNVNTK